MYISFYLCYYYYYYFFFHAENPICPIKKEHDIIMKFMPKPEASTSHKAGGVPMKKKTKKEQIKCILRIQPIDDLIEIELEVVADSKGTFSKRTGGPSKPAIAKNDKLNLATRIPSLIVLDTDVMNSFIDNLISCLVIEHHESNGMNSLCIV